ncbi:MAG: methyltransferase domain-containing protein [Verrucomicrobia bacterium]|nr:methyltransferase domain-containing protein [Verrucomicrobiota bacterium]NBU09619.1 methyltransferase domain-containing protein [Pseudomonadota bacterium]NDD37416.1 methyltransferase domain-containing protein [Verrucomicrobiota bacterium]
MKQPAASAPATLSPGLRRFLYGTAATTGAAILVVEILGAKMLSPYVGTSHFVWTAQIAVTLISLAAGYWFGGWLVDRSQNLRRLYTCILLAGLYLCFTVPFTSKVAFWCLQFPLAVGSLLASLFLFFVPLTLLATVGPFVIRVLTSVVAGVGGTVGRLSAISTLGSVLGTVLIGYVLIPFLPNSTTMFITAGVLMALAVVYFLVWREAGDSMGLPLALVVVGVVAGWSGVRADARPPADYMEEVARRNSNFGLMQVLENVGGSRRYYLNDYLTQNTYDPEAKQSVSLFTYGLHGLAGVYTTQIKDVLCIGMGVGIVPMQFAHEGAKVDVVEINGAVVGVAQAHFDLDPTKLNLTIGDGRQFVNAATKQYDAVILDAFLGDSSPSHLMTQEAFTAMRRVLRPNGVLVINSFGDFDEGKDYFTASLHKTLKSVFGAVRIHASGNGNVFFVATPAKELTQHRTMNFEAMHPTVQQQARDALAGIKDTAPKSGIVLTDDFNPVDFHDARNREQFRRQLAFSMKPK